MHKMHKILFVQKIERVSGSEYYLQNIIPSLARRGYKCGFLSLEPANKEIKLSEFKAKLSKENVNIHTLSINSNRFSFRMLKAINSIIKEGQYDIVHTHLVHADTWLAFVKLFFRTNFVLVSTKHSYDSQGYQKKYGFSPDGHYLSSFYAASFIAEKMIKRSSTISHGLKNLIVKLGLSKASKIDVIPYGFNFAPVVYDDANSSSYRKSEKQLIILGRLVPVKGHAHLINVMKSVLEVHPELSAVFVGDGTYKETLEEMVAAKGLQDAIHFEGFRKDIHNYIKNSDVMLVLSKAEGFGVVLLESYFHGTPVIAWDAPAMNEIVQHNVSGILLEPYKEDKLADALCDFFHQTPDYRKNLIAAGQERLENYYNIDRMTDDTVAFYHKATNNTQ